MELILAMALGLLAGSIVGALFFLIGEKLKLWDKIFEWMER